MTRWAISLVDGDGQVPQPEPGNPHPAWTPTTGPYRPRAALYGTYVTLIPGGPDGRPLADWCLIRLGDDADLAAADADDGVRVLPDWTMDHVLTAAQATQVNTVAARFGIQAQAQAGMTVGAILRWLRDRLDTTWNGVG